MFLNILESSSLFIVCRCAGFLLVDYVTADLAHDDHVSDDDRKSDNGHGKYKCSIPAILLFSEWLESEHQNIFTFRPLNLFFLLSRVVSTPSLPFPGCCPTYTCPPLWQLKQEKQELQEQEGKEKPKEQEEQIGQEEQIEQLKVAALNQKKIEQNRQQAVSQP